MSRFAPYSLRSLVPGGSTLSRTSRRVRNLMGRAQRIQCGWGQWQAWLLLTGQENIKTRTAECRAGTRSNREAATHVVCQPDGLQTRGGLDSQGNLWYIPR